MSSNVEARDLATHYSATATESIATVGAEARWTATACRALDVVVSVFLLVALLPVFAVIAIVIRLESPGRTVFRQERLGRRLAPFTINKFRTMRTGVSHETHRNYVHGLIVGERRDENGPRPMYKITQDERVTRVGHFLRRSSLDELPQLWNVLRGDMSLVGPRPPIAYEVELYPPEWFGRFAVKPGLTGLWQVGGRCELTVQEMIALDLEYARRRSLWLNLEILLRTLPAVVRGKGAA
jgi:lipopolysaccharide/colanic/teichoic acid biosynthesis glycosyltransferase